ncbi:FkbM family methyltransferase [Microvirga subterranea]|uniref:FkbM family methyltransferase n=1 Tax=Microvirga subterranea TaxID=186651 RepID=A0A370HJ30_9HYPH|nr:FkbM family methyltransferase [Microvirga subterranea]RDI58548.1 FkbM family methyltransferase [Microvirga subterranea]
MHKVEPEPVPIQNDDAPPHLEEVQPAVLQVDCAAPPGYTQPLKATPGGTAIPIKKLLRPFARAIFNAIRPLARPVAFRSRAYLTAEMMKEVETVQTLMQREAIALEKMEQTIERSFIATLQELRATRASTHVSLEKEVQSASAELMHRLEVLEQNTSAVLRKTTISCSNDETMVRTELGYVLCSASDHALLIQLIETGELEPGTRKLIQRLLVPGDVFVDVGANVGLHILAAARAMNGRGKIIAFEPFEPTKILLEKTIFMNGFSAVASVHHAAVSDQKGSRELFLGETSGHHSLFGPVSPSKSTLRTVTVPTVRLTDVIGKNEVVTMLKIDVEGAELDVLEGSKPIIENNPNIGLIVEFGNSHLRRRGHRSRDWLRAFTDLGLSYRAINEQTGELQRWSVEQLEATDSVNLFFSSPTSSTWAKAGANS